MNVFVLLYNSGTDKEGIHSIELKGRTIVLMFEDKDDATRYCGLLEAQDFPVPTVEKIDINEIKDDLKEFGVDRDAPDLFSSQEETSSTENLLSQENEDQEDDLEIPAFLRRQKN